MTVIDTSAWVEFLRDTGSPACEAVDALLGHPHSAVTDAISMEVLGGARDERHLHDLRRLLARASVLPTTPADYDEAAGLYRLCRRKGATVRRLIDCLIAAVTIRAAGHLLHADSDYELLARHTPLRLYDASA